jgi:hypothetical protein
MSNESLLSLKQSHAYQHMVKTLKHDADQYYPYQDAQGIMLGYIVRWNMVRQQNGLFKKEFRPFIRASDKHEWQAKGFAYPRPLFQLDQLVKCPEKTVLICEGEKAALAARELFPEFVTTTTMQGAQSAKQSDYKPLKNRHVIIAMDEDEAGQHYGKEVSAQCRLVGAKSVRFFNNVLFTHYSIEQGQLVKHDTAITLAKGYDLADAVCEGWTYKFLSSIETIPNLPLFLKYEEVFPYADHVDIDADTQALQRLTELSALEYDRLRKIEAKKLGVSVSALDQEVKKQRRFEQTKSEEESEIFPAVDPWPEPIIVCDLLQDITQLFKRFAILPTHADTALALWVMFTWVIDQVSVSPILAVSSPEKRCGKTTVISLLGQLVCKPLLAANISAAALFRTIELWQPTMIIDEADTFIRDSDELRGMINSGHTRPTAYVVRTTGDDFMPKRFSTWGAKAIAIIGSLPDTLHDRSIVISLRRKLTYEQTEKLRHADPQIFITLQRKLLRFAHDQGEIIRNTRLMFPSDLTISDRALDNWEPLFAIANLAGSTWTDKAYQAAAHLSGHEKEALPIGTELLSDIEKVFKEKTLFKIHTVDLINALCEDEESPWAMYNLRGQDKRITPRQLSRLLAPYHIHSRNIEIAGIQRKGFDRHTFVEAWERYH